MKPASESPFFEILTAWLCGFALLLPLPAGATAEQEWRFRVYLDEQEIGHHHFHLSRNGPYTELQAQAHFDVTFLKIPLFNYRHKNTEVWQSQCLQSITSSTDQNGKQFRVDGSADGEIFQLITHDGATSLPACISTFAYWDKSFLKRDRLLNSQTGEYLDVETRHLGEQSIRVGNREVTAHHYQLTAGKDKIELWYSQEGHWLALQSITRSGRLLRYTMN